MSYNRKILSVCDMRSVSTSVYVGDQKLKYISVSIVLNWIRL